MNNHSKRLCTHLESLDFYRDYDAEQKSAARRIYRHANEPETAIKVFDCMNDSTITTQQKNAARIIGLATSSSGPSAKERERANRTRRTAQQRAEIEARQSRAAKAEADYQATQAQLKRERELRDLRSLMQNGYGR